MTLCKQLYFVVKLLISFALCNFKKKFQIYPTLAILLNQYSTVLTSISIYPVLFNRMATVPNTVPSTFIFYENGHPKLRHDDQKFYLKRRTSNGDVPSKIKQNKILMDANVQFQHHPH